MIKISRSFECERCHKVAYNISKDFEHKHVHTISISEPALSGLPMTTQWQVCDSCLRALLDEMNKFSY